MFTDFIEALAGNQDFVLTWDIAVASFLFISSILYAFNIGPRKTILLILSIYGSLVLLFWFPFLDSITDSIQGINPDIVRIMLFAIFTFGVYYSFSGSMLKIRIPKPKRGQGPIWKISILGISLAGLICTFIFSQSVSFLIGSTSDLIEELFVKDVGRFVWTVLPIASIALSRKGKDK